MTSRIQPRRSILVATAITFVGAIALAGIALSPVTEHPEARAQAVGAAARLGAAEQLATKVRDLAEIAAREGRSAAAPITIATIAPLIQPVATVAVSPAIASSVPAFTVATMAPQPSSPTRATESASVAISRDASARDLERLEASEATAAPAIRVPNVATGPVATASSTATAIPIARAQETRAGNIAAAATGNVSATVGNVGAPALSAPPQAGGTSGSRVPILMYHYIRVNPDRADKIGYGLSIEPSLFQAHVDFMAARGYRAVTMRDAIAAAAGGPPLPAKAIALTFDDGYRDFFTEAWPRLRERGLTATVFQIVDLIDNWRYLTKAQLRELSDAGVEIGSHSLSHPDLRSLGFPGLRRELRESRSRLADIVARDVISFCYPAGFNSETVRQETASAGYASAVTVENGFMRPGVDRMAIPRIRVYGGMGLASLARTLGEPPPEPDRWSASLSDRAAP